MFDYRALYEIQLSVSVDFLRVVQFVTFRLLNDFDCAVLLQIHAFYTPVILTQPTRKATTIADINNKAAKKE